MTVFLQMVDAVRLGTPMVPSSEKDKEFFPQEWFSARVREAGITYEQQGRNSYPDYWLTLGATREGYEIKSLSVVRNRPARSDLDFNSTIPSGRKNGCEVFLVLFLYTGSGASPRTVHTISLAHGDLINSDHALADEHLNVAIHGFGAYADGFIRNRKMYVFPHPVTIDSTGLGKCRLIVPKEWNIRDKRLHHISTLDRKLAAETVESYTIRLRGKGQADVKKTPSADPGRVLSFDVFEAK